MPKAAHHHALARQWELLRLLPSRPPGITAGELAGRLQELGFGVSKRTVERDLVELTTLFGIVCNDRNTPYGWHWMSGEPANLPGISLTDAVSLSLIEDFVRPLLPAAMLTTLEARFRLARSKLQQLAEGNPAARWIDKVQYVPPTLALLPPQLAESVLATVQEGLLSERQIRIAYRRSSSAQSRELILHPLGIAQRGSVAYLVATAYDYADVRLYALHRMQSASVLDEPIRKPADFSLDRYIADGKLHFGTGEAIRLRARVNGYLASILEETPLAADQTIADEPPEKFIVEASLKDSWQLRWWLLSHGASIEIISPPELRQWAQETLAGALANYQPEHPPEHPPECPPASARCEPAAVSASPGAPESAETRSTTPAGHSAPPPEPA